METVIAQLLRQSGIQLRASGAPPAAADQQQHQGGGDHAPPAPAGATMVQVTPDEQEAISRLESLGFSRDRVVEAFLACDRNEQVAANYLFDHGMDGDEQD